MVKVIEISSTAHDFDSIALHVLSEYITCDELGKEIHRSVSSGQSSAHVFLDGCKYGMAKAIEMMLSGKLNIRIIRKD